MTADVYLGLFHKLIRREAAERDEGEIKKQNSSADLILSLFESATGIPLAEIG